MSSWLGEIQCWIKLRAKTKYKIFLFSTLFWAFSPMIFHTFSKGFISRLCGGHFITPVPSSSRKLNTILVLWQGTLFGISIGVSILSLRKWGRVCWWRCLFISTGINITVKMNNGSYSHWRNHPPHHYAPPPNFTVFLTH